MSSSDSSSSSGSNSGGAGYSTGITTPSPESLSPTEKNAHEVEQVSDLKGGAEEDSDDEDDFTSEYGDSLPPIPKTGKVEPLAIDSSTPDAWISRDERMIRLTGKHPYNVEAPLTDLWKAGFLTPQSLFYVRTHGATPHVSQDEAKTWKVRVHGLVKRETSFTIDDLKRLFPTITLPVTLVCAGNRRKEQNMVAKGLGFNWGAAGVSTGLFTGVYLADVLDYVRPIRPKGAFPYDRDTPGCAKHVIFEGCDQLPKGKYGTSQRLQWAKDRNKGMLLAWGLNGEPLSPDHGFPLRLVVPGQIGGRMVKWLDRIEVSDRESQHYLHFWDNKFLPTEVTADQARKEEHWWKDPKYIINDLNVNAAITVPAHNQVMQLSDSSTASTTTICGYAYTGGGKRVHRVEISLDEGRSWKLADIDMAEDKYRIAPIQDHPFFGTLDLSETEMSFAWCFWELTVDVAKLAGARSMAVRATDEGLAMMPRDMYWNAMSMMNNCWFRVAIHHERNDGAQLKFEHPTVAGNNPGGWMERMNEEGLNPRYPDFSVRADLSSSAEEQQEKQETGDAKPVKKEKVDVKKLMIDEAKENTVITAEDLAAHANEEQPWFVVHDHVYDGTAFLKDHPGGGESITLVAGEDATEDFMAIHSMDAKTQLRDFHVGKLAPGALEGAGKASDEQEDPNAPFLHPKHWKESKLVEKIPISHDSRIFRFALDREDQKVGLPVGQHVYVRVRTTGKDGEESETVQRAYTPFSGNEQKGYLDILIKVYFPCAQFPQGGKMTNALENLKVGEDCVELKGPLGHFIFEGAGQVKIHGHSRRIKNVAMIAGGSGITPIWSTLKALVDDEASSDVNVWILDANRTESDILAREHLDEVVGRAGARIKLWHVLSAKELPPNWAMGKGRVTTDVLRQHLPPAPKKPDNEEELEDTLVLLCGPPPMEAAVLKGLEELGWDVKRTVVQF